MRRSTLRRHDWTRILLDLAGAGLSLDTIGGVVGHSKAWASRLRTGGQVEPTHRDGEVLLAMWANATGRPASEAPRRDPFARSWSPSQVADAVPAGR